MKNFLIKKLFSLNRKLKLIIIFFLDLLIILCSTYGSLAIRFDQLNLFEIVDERYLITFEFFLIPIISYFTIAIFFKFYSYSFRQYNLGSYIFSSFPLIGLFVLIFNFIFNENFSFGAALINIILILSLIILSRKFISKIFNFFQKKNQKNTLIICSSKNIHKIYTYLKFNQSLNIKAISAVDFHQIDFSMYQNFKIKDVENVNFLIEDLNIKRIFLDKNYRNLKNKLSRKVAVDILDDNDLVKNINLDYKQQFIDYYFKLKNKVKFKLSNQYVNKNILITGAGGSIGKNLFYELLNSKAKKLF